MMSSSSQMLNNLDNVSEQELHSKLEKLTTTNSDLIQESEFYKRKHGLISQELDELLISQTRLETQLTHLESERDVLKKENHSLIKNRRDLETKIAKESKQFDADKLNWFNKEIQLRDQIRDLNIQISNSKTSQSPTSPKSRVRAVSMSVVNHPAIFGDDTDGPDTKTQATLIHENKLANKTIRIQLKEINELKSTASRLQQEITALGDQNRRYRQLEETVRQEIAQLKRANQTLQEDNESYQLLLRDRTLTGQFNMESYLNEDHDQFSGNGGQQTLGDALSVQLNGGGSTLAAALGGDFSEPTSLSTATNDHVSTPKDTKTKAELKQAVEENKKLKDENKALALYISKILGRIMSNPVLAEALSISNNEHDEEEAKAAETKAPAQSILSPQSNQGGKVSFDLPQRSPTTVKPDAPSTTSPTSTSRHPRRSKSVSVSSTSASSIFFSFKSPFKRSPPPAKPTETS